MRVVHGHRPGGRLKARFQSAFVLSLWIAGLAPGAGRLSAAPETGLDTPITLARGAFLATADGPASAITLPASLGFRPQKRTFSAAEFVGDRLAGGIAMVSRQRLAFYYRHFDNRATPDFDEDEYTLLFG